MSGTVPIFDVNNFGGPRKFPSVFIGDFVFWIVAAAPGFVNKCADNNSFTEYELAVGCSQFIERTEMADSGQQIDVGYLKDNPR